MAFSHSEIEKKWQQKWASAKCFEVEIDHSKPKFYALNMFPYPSGTGLHVGHLASFTPTEVVARFKRARGFNVLHPMGYDAFGLPAEQYAIETGIHPAITTQKAINNFRRQLQTFGYSYTWDREISSCDPKYYKWTQFIFLKLFEMGLAYQKEAPVNWCPALKTVLANEEVVDGKSERGGHPVVRLPMRQWMLKITAYADKLLEGLDKINWPEKTRLGQKNWIGRSRGAAVTFVVPEAADGKKIYELEVFTTRPDTLFGCTFMVLAPEHPLVKTITPKSHMREVTTYTEKAAAKSEMDRKAVTEKTGVFTGALALHPLTGKPLPIWIADYVLMDYGTGAIMAVPGHDARDFEFAQKFDLPVVRVLASEEPLPFEGDGQLVNSDFLNGLSKEKAIDKMVEHLSASNKGRLEIQFKLRDWLFSRQRYWGEPFPIIYSSNGEVTGVPFEELPVELPEVADYEPTEKGEPPLARVPNFVNYQNKKTGLSGKRETDTMPGSAGSSWYFLRYTDPLNSKALCDFEAQKYWMPVDLYVGGPEHTVGHLLYARFWQKVLFDAGLVSHEEPFLKLAHQGIVIGSDGYRMSKSRGNVVSVDDLRDEFGADTTRCYICFLGPFDKDKPWDSKGIGGVRRFLERFWRLCVNDQNEVIAKDLTEEQWPEELRRTYHKTIKKVGEDIEAMSFNTAISAMMILVNEVYKYEIRPRQLLKIFCQLLMPFAPHIAEELWSRLGGEGFVSLAVWPSYDKTWVIDDLLIMAVQVNGKMRGTIEVQADTPEADALNLARKVVAVSNALEGKSILKTIFKPGKILNVIVK